MEGHIRQAVSRFDTVALALARVLEDSNAKPCDATSCEYCSACCANRQEQEFLTVEDTDEALFYGVHGMGLCK